MSSMGMTFRAALPTAVPPTAGKTVPFNVKKVSSCAVWSYVWNSACYLKTAGAITKKREPKYVDGRIFLSNW